MVARHPRWRGGVLAILGAALVGSWLLSVALGAVSISPLTILKMLVAKVSFLSLDPTWREADEAILFRVRLPRVVGGALAGSALATAGVLFQGLLRNPLADPYVIGTSAGAALGATLALLLPFSLTLLGFGVVSLAAFAGASLAVMLVYNLARVGGQVPVVTLLLAGFAMSSLLGAVMVLIIAVSGQLQIRLPAVFSFLMGGVGGVRWEQFAFIAPLVALGVGLAFFRALPLNALSLGEEKAATLGISVEREKLALLALGSLLTAAAVSISGLIGFVGLVVPHAVRLVLGPDHRLLIPTAALAGASFLLLADLGARTLLAPREIPVGVITGLIGGPFFLYLLRRYRKGYAF